MEGVTQRASDRELHSALIKSANNALALKLRQDLQEKIKNNRKSRGLDDLHVDFTPKVPQPLTREEKAREEQRKKSNRLSAHRSRTREKEEKKKVEKDLKLQQERRNNLAKKLEGMLTEKNKLMDDLVGKVGLSMTHIKRTLGAIMVENKTLVSACVEEDGENSISIQGDEIENTNSPRLYIDTDTTISEFSEHDTGSDISPGNYVITECDVSPRCYVINECDTSSKTTSMIPHLRQNTDRTFSACFVDAFDTGCDVSSLTSPGSYVTGRREWETDSSECSSECMELRVVEGEEYGQVNEETEDVVTVYICYEDEPSAADVDSAESPENKGDNSVHSETITNVTYTNL